MNLFCSSTRCEMITWYVLFAESKFKQLEKSWNCPYICQLPHRTQGQPQHSNVSGPNARIGNTHLSVLRTVSGCSGRIYGVGKQFNSWRTGPENSSVLHCNMAFWLKLNSVLLFMYIVLHLLLVIAVLCKDFTATSKVLHYWGSWQQWHYYLQLTWYPYLLLVLSYLLLIKCGAKDTSIECLDCGLSFGNQAGC